MQSDPKPARVERAILIAVSPQGTREDTLNEHLDELEFLAETAGATTVPNPIFDTSPIPAGSCVVTGAFDQPLVITGNETKDIVITVSLSTNNSFEWTDNGDGLFQPEVGDAVVDMGVRGMVPFVQY